MEHFDTGNGGLGLLFGQTDDFDNVGNLNGTTLHTTGSDRATAGDREDVLDGHQERKVCLTLGSRNVAVNSIHELKNALVLGSVDVGAGGFESITSRAADDRNVVTGEIVLGQKIANFHLNEVKQFSVINKVGLV